MRAILYSAPGELQVTGLDDPHASPGMVLFRTAACGVCHTDIEVLHGHYGPGAFPLVPRHEYAGTVEAVGEGAGPIGMLMALALRDTGIDDVALVDIDEQRLKDVESLGLKPTPSSRDRGIPWASST